MAPPNAAPEKMLLDRSDASATIDLYRAALGPIRTDYYLKAFTRFDAAGRSSLSWNWEAALLTLNWLAFRRLWGAALAYGGAVVFAALLLFGIGRLVFQLPSSGLWGLLALLVLAAIAVPGALGNAWLYAATNKRIERALADSATLEEAQTLLQQQLAGRRRLGLLAGLNVVLCALVAVIVQSLPDTGSLPLNSSKMGQAPTATVEEWQAAQGKQAVAMASAPQDTASAPATQASNTVSRMSQGMVQVANSAAVPEPQSATSAPMPTPTPVSAPTPAPAASTPVAASAATPTAQAPAKAEKPAKVAKGKKAAKAEARAHAEAARSARAAKPKPAASSPAAAAQTADSYVVNVGLFADENNARNAYTKLKDAGLPAQSQEVKSSKGPRTRVRVGPFETQAEADRAADTIRGLHLEAQVFKP
ncbi:SPOR domain-containing protein [Rhodoferax sp. GW822-FHT02A01]|uniref:SPOR domain-containing protein n=1 Tax=Rhodoferax sp. GW822-FHT02A01 TaxID=3141537 RepID=UPI00315DB598